MNAPENRRNYRKWLEGLAMVAMIERNLGLPRWKEIDGVRTKVDDVTIDSPHFFEVVAELSADAAAALIDSQGKAGF